MSPRSFSGDLIREAPCLEESETVQEAVGRIRESGLPALPVVDGERRLTGIFGEREFMAALFPGYVRQLSYAGFVPHKLDDVFEKRASCRHEAIAGHMTTEHIDVGEDHSDLEVAETFLHHRVLILPVIDAERRVKGVITRSDFFHRLADRLAERG